MDIQLLLCVSMLTACGPETHEPGGELRAAEQQLQARRLLCHSDAESFCQALQQQIPGITVTAWSPAQWSSSTVADFQGFDLIYIHDSAGRNPEIAGAKAKYAAAVTGRIAITGLQFERCPGDEDACTALQSSASWILGGTGTGLLVSAQTVNTDWLPGTPPYDGVVYAGIGGGHDRVRITDPGHATMAGSTDASLSASGDGGHNYFTSIGGFTSVASVCTDGSSACPDDAQAPFVLVTSVTDKAANQAPVANAGPDQTLTCAVPGQPVSVLLDGSLSSDPDGDTLSFIWQEGEKLVASASNAAVSLGIALHRLTLTVDDGKGGTATDEVTINIQADTVPPVLTPNPGPSTIECAQGTTYADPGATATDACAGDLTWAVTRYSSVDLGRPTSFPYIVSYVAKDPAGNLGAAPRMVFVKDTQPPTVTPNPGPSTIECAPGTTYADPGATATDACAGDLTWAVTRYSSVDLGRPTSFPYIVSYVAKDPAGNLGAAPRMVFVKDTQPPAIQTSAVELWPPNHTQHAFTLADCASVTDTCNTGLDINAAGVITRISSDEPEDLQGEGDGNTQDDIVITGPNSFTLRAERADTGNGRVYGVAFTVKDAAGNTSLGLCRFSVPKDGPGKEAVDDGPAQGYSVPVSTVSR